ncbi:histidine phosphatase family protein [Lichenicoccus sp.]|uniref:histidine phosphatase family protein n=1 Tax=Lichenicoccus sp. TaxID=2781899 RepID=UPI003D0A7642
MVALLRHPAVRIAPGICYGRTDVPLADGWRQSIPALAASLATIAAQHIWSSPSSRCATLADALGSRLTLPVTCDEHLTELDFGAWEGRAWDALPRHDLDLWAMDPFAFRPPGGERGADLIARVSGFAAQLRIAAQPCIVVSHGGPLRVLPELLCDTPPSLLATPPLVGSLRIVTARRG